MTTSWPKYLAEVRERADKATQANHVWSIKKELIGKDLLFADAIFIAHSHSDVPRLIDRIEELTKALENAMDVVPCENARALLEKGVPE